MNVEKRKFEFSLESIQSLWFTPFRDLRCVRHIIFMNLILVLNCEKKKAKENRGMLSSRFITFREFD